MRKVFVLDTNVLLHDPRAIFKFDEHEVVVPIHVLEEIDQFKREMNELGRNARMVARFIDRLRARSQSTLQSGVDLDNGGRLRVAVPLDPLSNGNRADNKILRVALNERDRVPAAPTVFVTMDCNLRIRADAVGLRAEPYEGGRILDENLYTGMVRLSVSGSLVDRLAKRQAIPTEMLSERRVLFPNACVLLVDAANNKHSALGRLSSTGDALRPLHLPRGGAWGIRARNTEQSFALDLLLDDAIQLVTLTGRAGTGKTLLAVAAGLQQVVGEGNYARLLVSRPIFPLGRDIGYLPGGLEEKLNPWMQPVYDNFEHIFATGLRSEEGPSYQELLESGAIQVEPLTYIRGRTLPRQFMVVDEAQNLTPHEVKTIVSRCGANTKIVLTGDPEQIDNPYIDGASNGLTSAVERFRGEGIAAHITLVRGERSELAERAAELL